MRLQKGLLWVAHMQPRKPSLYAEYLTCTKNPLMSPPGAQYDKTVQAGHDYIWPYGQLRF